MRVRVRGRCPRLDRPHALSSPDPLEASRWVPTLPEPLERTQAYGHPGTRTATQAVREPHGSLRTSPPGPGQDPSRAPRGWLLHRVGVVIVVVLGIVAAVVLLWALREHRADDPRRRHPSTGGATKPNPWTQSVHVRIITESDVAGEDR